MTIGRTKLFPTDAHAETWLNSVKMLWFSGISSIHIILQFHLRWPPKNMQWLNFLTQIIIQKCNDSRTNVWLHCDIGWSIDVDGMHPSAWVIMPKNWIMKVNLPLVDLCTENFQREKPRICTQCKCSSYHRLVIVNLIRHPNEYAFKTDLQSWTP